TGGSVITSKPCASCHATSLKAEHAFTLSASGDGSVGCIDCRTDTTLGSADVIASGWASSKCSECHGAQHNSLLASDHDLSASASALGCSGAGCHAGGDISLLHADAVSGAATSCNVCHTSADTNLSWVVGCADAGCHQGMSAHAHSLDLAGSNYNDATQTGCTNSGAGCHGAYAAAEPTYLDFHPASGCTEGLCHTAANHDAPQFDDPNTCQNCHGGGALLYDHAPRTVPLDLTAPGGHYIVASHTASAGLGTVTASGSASATCSTCHDVTLRAAHGAAGGGFSSTTKGTLVTCYECHNYNAAVSAVVNADWTAGTCASCHTAGVMPGRAQHGATAPAVAGTQPAAPNACTRSGCHSFGSLNLHALHRDATGGCTLAGCHAKNKDMGAATRSCGTGGCHDGYESGAHAISDGGKACDLCHSALAGMVDDESSYHHVLDHATPFMAPDTGGTYPTSRTEMACVSCHVDHDMYQPLPGGQGKAYSLRNSATVANPTAVNTDDGLCLSCHDVSLARNTTGQKDNTIQETRVWRIDPTLWQESPHNYDAPGDFNDGSTFYANC
ncbi:MAG: hypothetical protein Q8M66_07860, partial [Actinomycetota bacterium]|nr:hypothetical protein [Actinomycetota bacterium]